MSSMRMESVVLAGAGVVLAIAEAVVVREAHARAMANPAGQCRVMRELVPGVSIGGVRPGMPRAQIARLGIRLRPEGVQREPSVTGWVSGTLLVLTDARDVVSTVSYDLRYGSCLRVGRRILNNTTTLPAAREVLGPCAMQQGSGGNALECTTAAGAKTFAYDTHGSVGSLNVQIRR